MKLFLTTIEICVCVILFQDYIPYSVYITAQRRDRACAERRATGSSPTYQIFVIDTISLTFSYKYKNYDRLIVKTVTHTIEIIFCVILF